ncbi:hypothetical protein CYMTET_5588 [Cymbomonas tetramitiformis]|uniref:Uncharacterized protein n=1 Tax=Cymbomonas tetramitiformis TaxID=36881 RepID=A0AAE0GZ35_9CHLO|nr:hypothetical protein CYMTET_5588 [Cymbomonas tetramitiformis]
MARLTVDSPGSSSAVKQPRQPKRIAKPPAASTSSVPIISVPETPVPSAQSSPRKSELSDRISELEARISELTTENCELKVSLSDSEAELLHAETELSEKQDHIDQLTATNLEKCTLTNQLNQEIAALKKTPATKIRVLKSPDRTETDQHIIELTEKNKNLEERMKLAWKVSEEYVATIRVLKEQLAAGTPEETPLEKATAMANKRKEQLATEAEEKKQKKAAAASDKKDKGKQKVSDPKPVELQEREKSWWDSHYREFPEDKPADWVFDSVKAG